MKYPIGTIVKSSSGRRGVVVGHTESKWADNEIKFDDSDYATPCANGVLCKVVDNVHAVLTAKKMEKGKEHV